MNVASDWSAGELSVRLCFLVKVRKARGRREGGGRRIGRIVEMAGLNAGGGIGRSRGLMGWTGVPNAGLEEGIAFSCLRNAAAMVLLCCVFVPCAGQSSRKTNPDDPKKKRNVCIWDYGYLSILETVPSKSRYRNAKSSN